MGLQVQPYDFAFTTHRHGAAEPYDFTEYVQSGAVALGTVAPWETITLNLRVPSPKWGSDPVPRIGDWIVVYDRGFEEPRAVGWGYCADISGSATANLGGTISTSEMRVSVISWMSLLDRCRVMVAPGFFDNSVGGLLTPKEFFDIQQELRSILFPGLDAEGAPSRVNLGNALQRTLELLNLPELPESLSYGDGTFTQLGVNVNVVSNGATASRYAVERAADEVPGWSVRNLATQSVRDTSVLKLIMGTWGADINMVEMFPTLEPYVVQDVDTSAQEASPYEVADATPAPPAEPVEDAGQRMSLGRPAQPGERLADRLPPETTPWLDDPNSDEILRGFLVEAGSESPVSSPVTTGPTITQEDLEVPIVGRTLVRARSGVSEALNANVVLMYRMRPWRTESLRQFVQGDTSLRPRSQNAENRYVDNTMFRGTTWASNPGEIRAYSASEVQSFTWSFSDDFSVNAVTIGLPAQPDNPLRYWERAGLPFVAERHIEKYGLRMYEPQWPFWPVFNTEDEDATLDDQLRTVGAQAAQFMGNAARFASGTVTVRYDRTLRAGMAVKVGSGLNIGGQPGLVEAYVEAVTHTFARGERGAWTARTTFGYTRGEIAGGDRGTQFSPEDA